MYMYMYVQYVNQLVVHVYNMYVHVYMDCICASWYMLESVCTVSERVPVVRLAKLAST